VPGEIEASKDASRWTNMVADYEALAEPLSRQYARAALAMVGGIGHGARVLDVAAGTGSLSLLAAEAGAQVVATDLSPGMVARLAERLAGYPGCTARVMDGQALDVSDGAFDATFSIFGICLFPDWRKGLRELARSTCTGGHGCVAVWRDPEGAVQRVILVEAFSSIFPDGALPPMPEGVLVLASLDALEAEMALAGFSNVTVRAVDGAWTGASVDALVTDAKRISRFVPSFAELERSDGDQLTSALREALERYVSGGVVSVPCTALVALGQRL